MFHFPAFPPHALCVQAWVTPHDWGRVSPFGYPWISARLTAPQGFSQSPTSFIGSWCQGIHRVPLITCHKDARIHCAVLKEQPDTARIATRLPDPKTGGSGAGAALLFLAEENTHVFSQDPTAYRTEVLNLLLRKEVIQPHLPVRLPCYDFVPIASPTFDRSPPYGLGHGLRVLPTFVT